jgi:hypothetical protein
MKWNSIFLFFLFLIISGCDLQQKKRELNEREIRLNEKEQRLGLKEKTLWIKEQELSKREQKLDALTTDSLRNFNPAIIGKWAVKMTCILASCPGFAVGDTKTEIWDISYQANKVIINALASDKLVRVYAGTMSGNNIELEESKGDETANGTKMSVALQLADNFNMEGKREIERNSGCKVVYDLKLEKQ